MDIIFLKYNTEKINRYMYKRKDILSHFAFIHLFMMLLISDTRLSYCYQLSISPNHYPATQTQHFQ